MEAEGSLLCSQEPSTGPYPEPNQSSPYQPILSLLDFNIIHPLRLGPSSGLFASGFPTNIYMRSSSLPFVLHALPISSSFTWSF
jgi:hypothetical protein